MGKSLDRTMPSARKEGLIVQELAGELLVYDRMIVTDTKPTV